MAPFRARIAYKLKGLKAIGQMESWLVGKGKDAILRDLTRPKANGLANSGTDINVK